MKANQPAALTKRLQEINREAALSRKALKAFFKTFPNAADIIDQLNECSDTYGHVSYLYGGSISITQYNLTTFRDERLVDLLLMLEDEFKIEFTMEDVPAQSRKRFTAVCEWYIGESKRRLDITVSAELSHESSLCQRVQIGTEIKTVETPIYRLDCPEINDVEG